MNIEKRLDDGSTIMSVTIPEFLACVDYAIIDKTKRWSYPDMLIDAEKLAGPQTLKGYKSLIDQKLFGIDADGYPVIEIAARPLVWLTSSIRNHDVIVNIKVAVDHRRMTFVFLHDKSSWVLYWKSKTVYRFISGLMVESPGMALHRSIIHVLDKAKVGKVSVAFIVKNDMGRDLSSTVIASNEYGEYVEQEPDPMFVFDARAPWPVHYSQYSILDRFDDILKGV